MNYRAGAGTGLTFVFAPDAGGCLCFGSASASGSPIKVSRSPR